MKYLLPIIGMMASFLLLKYRAGVGNIIGEAEWMRKIGGVYNVVIITAIVLFFWSLAALTGTTDFFLRPLTWLVPGGRNTSGF